jgi:putative SOS response-associated peptidase YedK
MCGRYVAPDDLALEREFNLVRTEWQFPASYNAAPTQQVPVVRSVEGAARHASPLGSHTVLSQRRAAKVLDHQCKGRDSGDRGELPRSQVAAAMLTAGDRLLRVARGRRKPQGAVLHNAQPLFAFAALWDRPKKWDGTAVRVACISRCLLMH